MVLQKKVLTNETPHTIKAFAFSFAVEIKSLASLTAGKEKSICD